MLYIGVTESNEIITQDLLTMDHMLVCGGSCYDRTAFMKGLVSDLTKSYQNEVKLVLSDIDGSFSNLEVDESYLWCPKTNNCRKTVSILDSLIEECKSRAKLLESNNTKSVIEFNKKVSSKEISDATIIPHIVVLINEFQDLTYIEDNRFYNSVSRLTSIARPFGIHIIIGTHRTRIGRPINATILMNFPLRVCFKVKSGFESLAILNMTGAEQLDENGGEFITNCPNAEDSVKAITMHQEASMRQN